jgi:hypothetical protein
MKLLAKGRTLVCEISDFDACDKYLFHIDAAEGGVTAAWKLKGCGDNGTVAVGKKAVESATKLISFGQGSVSRWKGAVASNTESCDEGCNCHTLPFLLSRTAYRSLKGGEPVELNVFGEIQTFTKQGTEKRTIEIDGKKTSVQALHATSDDGDLWVADDAQSPVLLRVETCGGDNYCEVESVSDQSIEDAEAKLEEE